MIKTKLCLDFAIAKLVNVWLKIVTQGWLTVEGSACRYLISAWHPNVYKNYIFIINHAKKEFLSIALEAYNI